MRIRALFIAALMISGLTACQVTPHANPDSTSVLRGGYIDIPVLQNDKDPRSRALTVVEATEPSQGKVVVNADQTIRYEPRADARGEDVFTYSIKNTRGRTSSALVKVAIVEPAADKVLGTPEPRVEAKQPTGTLVPLVPPPPVALTVHPPVAGAPLPKPVAGAAITGISVTLFTRENDKDAGETVQLTLKRGEEVLADQTVGTDGVWAVQTDRTVELQLAQPIAASEAKAVTLEVRKVVGPGLGGSWMMQVDVQGRMSDGRTVQLVPKSLPFLFGGGSSNNRSWQFVSP